MSCSLTFGGRSVSTGQGSPVVACRGASLPRKKDAHYNCQSRLFTRCLSKVVTIYI